MREAEMIARALICPTVLLLTGCGLAHQAELRNARDAAFAEYHRAIASCQQQFPNATVKPTVPRVKCMAAAQEQFAVENQRVTGSRELPMVRARLANDVLISEKFDSGRMSEGEYRAALAANEANYAVGEQQRANADATLAAAQSQAAAAQSQAAIAQQKAIADEFQPKTTTCNTFGNTVTCY